MNIDHRNPRLRRGFAFVALAALLGLAAIGLTQCRLVDDTVTGVDLKSHSGLSHGSTCVKPCREAYKLCKKAEDARHKTAIRACGGDKVCKKDEDRLHKQNRSNCKQAWKDCKAGCYNEGAGSGGR